VDDHDDQVDDNDDQVEDNDDQVEDYDDHQMEEERPGGRRRPMEDDQEDVKTTGRSWKTTRRT